MKKGATRKSRPKTKNAHTPSSLFTRAHTHTSYIGDSIRVCVADNTECLYNVAAKSEY